MSYIETNPRKIVQIVKEDVVSEVGIEKPGQNNTKEKVCSVWDKKFMKPSQLVRHKRVHTGERHFACLMLYR